MTLPVHMAEARERSPREACGLIESQGSFMAQQARAQAALIIDSDADIRLAVRDLLEEAGYVVVEAATPNDGMAMLRAREDCTVVVFSNSEPQDAPALSFFQEVATETDLATGHAYLYLTTTPHVMLSELKAVLAAMHVPVVSKPFEIMPMLNSVAAVVRERC